MREQTQSIRMPSAHATRLQRAGLQWLGLLIILAGMTLPASAKEFVVNRGDLEQMRQETEKAINYLQWYHYKKEPITRINQEDMLVSYMGELDYNRLFFLQRDKEEILGRFGNTLIDSYFRQGKWLYPAFQIFQIYRDNSIARLSWVSRRLKGEFDFSTDLTFVPDRSEADWPKDAEEANELWENRITFDLLQEILNGETEERAREKVGRRYRRTLRYIEGLEPRDAQEIFLTSFAQMYDPHSTFYSPDTWDDFTIGMSNSLVGIGALLRDEDGYCVIQRLLPGGPAELSNQFHPGDKIVEVRQEAGKPVDVIDMKLRKIVENIRGPKGTKVHLTIIPANATDPSERKEVTLVRDEIKLTENLASAAIYEFPLGEHRTVPLGVIDLPSFYGSTVGDEVESSTTQDVEELIGNLKKQGIEGLVLDLRRNGGGLLSEAIKLTGLFIPKGPVVQVKDTTGQIREDWDTDPKVVYEGPMVVLVSRRSASASEIVAGALQNHHRALIVGDSSTHGKGTVQQIFELDRKSGLAIFNRPKEEKLGATKITIQKFYLPNGDSTQNKGVVSDIVLPSINEYLPMGESDLPNALVWDAIEPLKWNPKETVGPNGNLIEDDIVSFLRDASETRQNTLEEFTYLERQIDWFQKKQEEEEFSLNLEVRRTQRAIDNKFKEEMDDQLEILSRNYFQWHEVVLEISREKEELHQAKLRNSLLPNGKSKSNAYYQKVFYFQSGEDEPIKEIWVESIDYEKLIKHSDEIAAELSEYAGVSIPESKISDLLNYFKNAETSDEFNVERTFATYLGNELDEEAIGNILPRFFTKLVTLDPQLLLEKPPLDIPLRESIRILADWVVKQRESINSSTIATLNPKDAKMVD